EAANFIMPNRELRPQESWQVQLPMILKTGAKAELVELVMNCTYEGTRTRAGNSEALVSFEGRVQGRNTLKDRVDGDVAGKFTFDAARGFISASNMTILSESSQPGGELQVVFAFELELTRVEGNPRKLELPRSEPSPSAVSQTPPRA